MFVTSFITGTITSVGAYYKYPALEDGLAVENMYVIPGDGDDHPLAPGESLVLALAAIDYTHTYGEGEDAVEGNTQAIDLSKADFEFYDENEYWPAAFDAGWTFCGEYDGDPARLGKSVRRSVNAEGKLVDTNNSTNDFTPNATPSLK